MSDAGGGEALRVRRSIAMIDDETALVGAMQQTMADDFDIETAGSVEAAERGLAVRNFDLVICDHLMPGERGLDFLTRAKDRYPAMRCILMTGYMNPDFLRRSAQTAELIACILKPIRPRELQGEVRELLAV